MSIVSRPIAFFDSGVGGLTVLNHAMNRMVGYDYIYYADSANVPYGNKSSSEIIKLVSNAVDQIKGYNPLALVIACNTATSVSIDELRENYSFPVIGMEPAVKPAAAKADPRKILVAATGRTLAEKKYEQLIKSLGAGDRVEELILSELIEFAEEFDFDSPKLNRFLRSVLSDIDWESYHSLVLGCTHFPFYRQQIRKFIPDHISILEGTQGTVTNLHSKVASADKSANPTLKVILSGMEVEKEVVFPYLKYLQSRPAYM